MCKCHSRKENEDRTSPHLIDGAVMIPLKKLLNAARSQAPSR